jgi:hypothetical protein
MERYEFSKFKYEFKPKKIEKGFPIESGPLGCIPARPTAHNAQVACQNEPIVAGRGLPTTHLA